MTDPDDIDFDLAVRRHGSLTLLRAVRDLAIQACDDEYKALAKVQEFTRQVFEELH